MSNFQFKLIFEFLEIWQYFLNKCLKSRQITQQIFQENSKPLKKFQISLPDRESSRSNNKMHCASNSNQTVKHSPEPKNTWKTSYPFLCWREIASHFFWWSFVISPTALKSRFLIRNSCERPVNLYFFPSRKRCSSNRNFLYLCLI